MSLIKVKGSSITGALAAVDGSALTGIAGGKILKVTTAEYTSDSTSTSSSYSTFLTLSVTPTAANSNLLAIASLNFQMYGNNSTQTPDGKICIATPSDVIRAQQGYSLNSMLNANDGFEEITGSIMAYWNQNTTSAFDVRLRFAVRSAGRMRVFGNSVGDPFNPSPTRLTVLEVAA